MSGTELYIKIDDEPTVPILTTDKKDRFDLSQGTNEILSKTKLLDCVKDVKDIKIIDEEHEEIVTLTAIKGAPLTFMPDITRDMLYGLMSDTHKIFKECNVDYFAESGTLLGAIRHHDLIPWDDDLDIGIFEKDMEIVAKNVLPKLSKLGYTVHLSGDIMKVVIPDMSIIEKKYNRLWGSPCLDIFVHTKVGDKYVYNSLNHRTRWENAYIYASEMFPLREYKFGSITIKGPKNGLGYCDRLYPDWRRKFAYDVREYDPVKKCSKNKSTVRYELELPEGCDMYTVINNMKKDIDKAKKKEEK
jgi:phosphorylcholine metabolism protein LicD